MREHDTRAGAGTANTLERARCSETKAGGVSPGRAVGRPPPQAPGMPRAGKRVFEKPLPNSEPRLRALFEKLTAKFGTVLVIVDQPASIGALPLTVARD